MERSVALEKDDMISSKSLPMELLYHVSAISSDQKDIPAILATEDFSFSEYIDELSRRIIAEALEMNGSNIKKTAETLRLSYRSLRYLIEKYQLR